mmetsp:Transcript_8043/g.24907  ORF Transcript_8043/g.24907 Transcript_8043/m.24907 type:complete len:539 (-) Transcript_8043:208-1824(-)|eukprot:CAMPEP_0174239290 /NCGR_PEP_ID=MMETSP0417-20130205/14108_1 /TAXON_ID=242541 /ORGANISM="Mayorella sp, Strain BSH-02190019" /LENGTH=538 /DNA_ID=CAMNT_0015318221 /DNA_START=139 /DNA_END=1755 /DNA_ORIENTATION=+
MAAGGGLIRISHDGTFKTLLVEEDTQVSDMLDLMVKKCSKGMSDDQRAQVQKKFQNYHVCVQRTDGKLLACEPSMKVYDLTKTSQFSQLIWQELSAGVEESMAKVKAQSARLVRVSHDGTFKTLLMEDSVLVSDMLDVMVKKCTKGMTDAQRADVRQKFANYRLFVKRTDGTLLSCASSMTVTALCQTPNYQEFVWSEDPVPVSGRLEKQSTSLAPSIDEMDLETLTRRAKELEANVERLNKQITERASKMTELPVNMRNIEVLEKIAEVGGSNATVSLCFVDGWRCVVKQIDIEDANMVQSLKTEISIVANLPDHANVVRYFYYDQAGTYIRLFMEEFSGTLGDIVSARKKAGLKGFPVEQILMFSRDILEGLDFLHKHKVIHRDLKSDNVFVRVDNEGKIKRLALGDFDTAKKLTKTTDFKTIIGTPSFMAPEVLNARESGSYSFSADIYSFGMIIYELMTLQTPFDNLPPFKVSECIIKGERPGLPRLSPKYQPVLLLHRKCTEYDPTARPTLLQLRQTITQGLLAMRKSRKEKK